MFVSSIATLIIHAKNVIETRKFINNNPIIVIEKGDIVRYRGGYISEMEKMVQNTNTTYIPLNKDSSTKFHMKTNNLLMDLRKESTFKKLIRHNAVTPKLYGLKKTYKNNVNFRLVFVVSNHEVTTFHTSVYN